MASTLGVVKLFDQQSQRIKRIVEEEFSGYSAAFDRTAWPMVQFRLQDQHGALCSLKSLHFSISELQEFSDSRLRAAIQKLRSYSKI
jgi:hypothetical protein